MQRPIRIISTRNVEDASVISISSARYQDSAPFSGQFEVVDVDICIGLNAKTQKQVAFVYCHVSEGQSDDEMIEVEIDDPIIHTVEGYSGAVIDRIAFDQ